MASRLIFLHRLYVLKRRGRLGVGWKATGSAYPGHRRGRSALLKGTGDPLAFGRGDQSIPRDEKSRPWSMQATVPQTDTGTRGENPKACEITTAKERGKFTP
jgi:hypothetical protein